MCVFITPEYPWWQVIPSGVDGASLKAASEERLARAGAAHLLLHPAGRDGLALRMLSYPFTGRTKTSQVSNRALYAYKHIKQ